MQSSRPRKKGVAEAGATSASATQSRTGHTETIATAHNRRNHMTDYLLPHIKPVTARTVVTTHTLPKDSMGSLTHAQLHGRRAMHWLCLWDRGGEGRRRRVLEAFVYLHNRSNAHVMQVDMGEAAPLFFARLTSCFKITYKSFHRGRPFTEHTSHRGAMEQGEPVACCRVSNVTSHDLRLPNTLADDPSHCRRHSVIDSYSMGNTRSCSSIENHSRAEPASWILLLVQAFTIYARDVGYLTQLAESGVTAALTDCLRCGCAENDHAIRSNTRHTHEPYTDALVTVTSPASSSSSSCTPLSQPLSSSVLRHGSLCAGPVYTALHAAERQSIILLLLFIAHAGRVYREMIGEENGLSHVLWCVQHEHSEELARLLMELCLVLAQGSQEVAHVVGNGLIRIILMHHHHSVRQAHEKSAHAPIPPGDVLAQPRCAKCTWAAGTALGESVVATSMDDILPSPPRPGSFELCCSTTCDTTLVHIAHTLAVLQRQRVHTCMASRRAALALSQQEQQQPQHQMQQQVHHMSVEGEDEEDEACLGLSTRRVNDAGRDNHSPHDARVDDHSMEDEGVREAGGVPMDYICVVGLSGAHLNSSNHAMTPSTGATFDATKPIMASKTSRLLDCVPDEVGEHTCCDRAYKAMCTSRSNAHMHDADCSSTINSNTHSTSSSRHTEVDTHTPSSRPHETVDEVGSDKYLLHDTSVSEYVTAVMHLITHPNNVHLRMHGRELAALVTRNLDLLQPILRRCFEVIDTDVLRISEDAAHSVTVLNRKYQQLSCGGVVVQMILAEPCSPTRRRLILQCVAESGALCSLFKYLEMATQDENTPAVHACVRTLQFLARAVDTEVHHRGCSENKRVDGGGVVQSKDIPMTDTLSSLFSSAAAGGILNSFNDILDDRVYDVLLHKDTMTEDDNFAILQQYRKKAAAAVAASATGVGVDKQAQL